MRSLLDVVLTQPLQSWHLFLNTPSLTAIYKAVLCMVGSSYGCYLAFTLSSLKTLLRADY